MVNAFRPKLGMGLQNLVAGDQPDWQMPNALDPSRMTPGSGDTQAKKPGFFGEGGMGRYLAGAIGDALLQNGGMAPVFAPMQQDKRRAEMEQAQWGLRRKSDLADYETKQQIEAKYRKPDVPPMLRDLAAWQGMTPEQQTAYAAMRDANAGPITTTLPNGQLYIGPKSGLAAALGAAAAPTAAAPLKPVGKLRPVGGPTAPQSGGFR